MIRSRVSLRSICLPFPCQLLPCEVMTPISAPMSYVVPTSPVHCTVPDAPASISCSTFSVAITKIGEPSSTCSPAGTSSSVSSASETATDTRGMRMVNSATRPRPFQSALSGGDDPLRGRVHLRLERSRRGIGNEPGGHPLNRCREFTEQFSLQDRGNLCSRTGELHCVVDDYRPAGSAHRFDDDLDIQRDQGPQVDDLGADVLAGQDFRCGQRIVDGAPVAYQRHVLAGPLGGGLTQRNPVTHIDGDRPLLARQANR